MSRSDKDQTVDRNLISDSQGVPKDYTHQIMNKLRKAGVLESRRGRGGGYKLGRTIEEISIWDIFSAVEDDLRPVKCLSHETPCGLESNCSSKSVWSVIYERMGSELKQMRLSDFSQSHLAEGLSSGNT